MASHQRLQLTNERAVLAEHEVGVDPILDGRESQLIEPQGLRPGPSATATIGQGVASPETQGVAQLRRRTRGVTFDERAVPGHRESLETCHVDGIGRCAEHVARRTSLQDVRQTRRPREPAAPERRSPATS